MKLPKNTAVQESIASLQHQIKTSDSIIIRAGGTKTALSAQANLDIRDLSGVLEYDPQEYTLTALAGTPLKVIETLLDKEGQYMPFDPVLVNQGASLGGSIVTGLSGSGRFRYGGIRDFLLGLKFITSNGSLHTGGAKVIKNASGFDLPKLMIGSLGKYGVITEATLKVFPKPESFTTLSFSYNSLQEALEPLRLLARSAFELSALDLMGNKLIVRFGGLAEAAAKRKERIEAFVKQEADVLEAEQDDAYWKTMREFAWLLSTENLVKIPLTLSKILAFDEALGPSFIRRYSVGGNVAWVKLDDNADKAKFDALLKSQGLAGLALTGVWQQPLIGKQTGQVFNDRLRSVLDPEKKFGLKE